MLWELCEALFELMGFTIRVTILLIIVFWSLVVAVLEWMLD